MDNVPVWEDGSVLGLPELVGDLSTDVCVVGLGGSGLAAVAELLALGIDVVGVEAGTVAGGAAGRNGGFLLAGLAAFHHDAVKSLGREQAVELYRATAEELERVALHAPRYVRLPGSLRVADTAEELQDCEEQYDQMRSDDLAVERYRGPEGVGLLFPNDGVFNPLLRCRQLAGEVIAGGARLFERSAVTHVEAGRLTTARGVIECRSLIVAVDGRLNLLLPELATRVRTARLQMLATVPTDEVTLPRAVYRRYGYEYYQQLPDGSIALGGFRDKGGDGEWTTEATPSAVVQGHLEGFLRTVVGVNAPVASRWAASVGYSNGVLPVFERVRGGVIACGGYNGTGNLVGALLGRGAAQVAVTGWSAIAASFTGSGSLS